MDRTFGQAPVHQGSEARNGPLGSGTTPMLAMMPPSITVELPVRNAPTSAVICCHKHRSCVAACWLCPQEMPMIFPDESDSP